MTTTQSEAHPRASRRISTGLVALGLIATGIVAVVVGSYSHPHTDLEVVVVILGGALIVAGALGLVIEAWDAGPAAVALSVTSVTMVSLLLIRDFGLFSGIRVYVVSFLVACVLGLVALLVRTPSRATALVLGAAATIAFIAGSVSVLGTDVDMDVVELHDQAAAAILAGDNPYTTGNVAVMEDRPGDDLELIEEYTYPPVTLAWYTLAYAVFGDSRWAGAIGIALAIALLAVAATSSEGVRRVAIAAIAVVVANPVSLVMVSLGWNEAVAFPAFVLALMLWRRVPIASAIALGIAIATKQYLVIGIPLLFATPDRDAWKRGSFVAGTVVATYLPFVLWDAEGLVRGTFIHHLTRMPRPDGLTLGGIGIEIPGVVALLVGAGVGVVVGFRRGGAGPVLLANAAAVASFTLLAARGFRNSWWLVVCLAGVALVARPVDGRHRSSWQRTSIVDTGAQAQVPDVPADTHIES